MKMDSIFPGTVIGNRYRIDHAIGEGGMGRVYHAVHLLINRPVAVKMLKISYKHDSSALLRIQQEAKIIGSLESEHICEVIDMGIHTGTPYLVMPLLRGISLREILVKQPILPLDRAVGITLQILCGLSVAHQDNIIHCDLTPANIVLTQSKIIPDFVKLIDFGISKIVQPYGKTEHTCRDLIAGTPHYMAPEQVERASELDHRVDIYTTGVVLYEMLTGQRPYTGSTHEVLENITSSSFILPSTLNTKIPAEIEKVVLTAMSRDPKRRFDSTNAMRKALFEAFTFSHSSENVNRTFTETDLSSFNKTTKGNDRDISDDDNTHVLTNASLYPYRVRKSVLRLRYLAAFLIGFLSAFLILTLFFCEEMPPSSHTPSQNDLSPKEASISSDIHSLSNDVSGKSPTEVNVSEARKRDLYLSEQELIVSKSIVERSKEKERPLRNAPAKKSSPKKSKARASRKRQIQNHAKQVEDVGEFVRGKKNTLFISEY